MPSQSFLENSSDAFFALDRAWRLTFLNRQAAVIVGRSADEVLGCVFWEIFPEALGSEFELLYQRAMDEQIAGETTAFYPNHHRWYEVHAYPAPDGITIVARDVSQQVQALEALRASEERFRAVQETSIDGFMVLESLRDATGQIYDFRWAYANQAAERLVGKPRSWFLGRQLLEEMPGNRDEGLFDAYVRVVETGQPWSHEFSYQHEGLDVFFRLVAAKAGDGFAVSFADLSERRRAEERVRQSEERYRAFVANSSEGVYRMEFNPPIDTRWPPDAIIDQLYLSGRFAECNDAFARMYGFERAEDLVGSSLDVMLPPSDPQVREYLRLVIDSDYRVADVESIERDRHGNVLYFANSITGVIESGQIVRAWGTQRDVTERRLAEDRIRENEERYRHVIGSIEQGFCVFEMLYDQAGTPVDYRFLEVNPMFERHTGLQHAAGKTARELVPGLEQHWMDIYGKVVSSGEPYRFEQGSLVMGRVFAVEAVRVGGAGSRKVAALFTDVTERRQTENDLRFLSEMSERIRLATNAQSLSTEVLRSLCDYLYVTRGFIAEIDDAANRWTVHDDYHYASGLPSIAGTYPFAPFPPDIVATLRAGRGVNIHDTAENPYAASFEPLGIRSFAVVPMRREDRWSAALTLCFEQPHLWSSRELTLLETVAERLWNAIEKLRLEAARAEYAARLQQLNTASLAINAATTRDHVLGLITTAAADLIGAYQSLTTVVSEQHRGQSVAYVALAPHYASWQNDIARLEIAHLHPLVEDLTTPLRRSQDGLQANLPWLQAQKDDYLPLRGLLVVPLIGSSGQTVGFIHLSDKAEGEFSNDDQALLVQLAQVASVALEKQTLYEGEQRARAQAEEASRLKDEFLATVSHELRTPLTSILGYAQLLQVRKRDEAYVARTVDKMLRSARTQAQLIEDLLDVSRIVSGKLRIDMQPVDLMIVIHAALDTVRPTLEAKGLHLKLDLDPSAGAMIGDPNRLQQVVWNLLSNAAKFTPSGGTISIGLRPHGSQVQLTISDTGQGISTAFLPFAFDRFRQAEGASTRSYGGLGLGLSIVRHLVELHGGSVQAASDGEGQGTTFTVLLPQVAADGIESHIEETSAKKQVDLHGLRVLVVDDQATILELLHDILSPHGAMVTLAASASEALATLQHWRPDLLISDIAMPEHDGYWLIEQVRALPPEAGGQTPALALTAYVRVEEQQRVFASGFQHYVPKPIDTQELLAVVAGLRDATAEPWNKEV